jgi:hypothetical protein
VWRDIAALVVSPGIPHLYPEPNRVIAEAMAAGVPVDNDIGLFFRSLATDDWDSFDTVPRVVAVTGSNGKSTTSALIHHILVASGRESQLAGNIGRGVLDIDPPGEGGSWCWSCRPIRRTLRARSRPTSRSSRTSRPITSTGTGGWGATSRRSAGSLPKAVRTAP